MFAAKSSGSATLLLVYVVIFGALYFFYLRPRSKRQKAQRSEARKVEIGDRAQTIGGFVGVVTKNTGELITLRSSGGAELDFVPQAIAKKLDLSSGEASA